MPSLPNQGRPPSSNNKATAIKIAQVARWKIAGVSNVRIADMLGMTPNGVKLLTETPEYIEYEAALLEGHLSAMDEALAGKVNIIHQQFRVAVPAALRCLVDSVTQRRDLKAALVAAKEILDRDPDRTLVSQAARKDGEQEAPKLPDEVLAQAVTESNEIAQALNKADTKGVN